MRKFDLSLRSSRSSYFATFRHQLTILSKTDALDEEKWLNMLGTFVKEDRKSGSAGMPRPISYAVFCLKKKKKHPTKKRSQRRAPEFRLKLHGYEYVSAKYHETVHISQRQS